MLKKLLMFFIVVFSVSVFMACSNTTTQAPTTQTPTTQAPTTQTPTTGAPTTVPPTTLPPTTSSSGNGTTAPTTVPPTTLPPTTSSSDSGTTAPTTVPPTTTPTTSDPNVMKEYIFEAEYVDFDGISGSGWSNTQVEWGMVMGDGETTATSNGMYVAYFTPPYASLKFPFTSSSAGKGELIFSMVTEYAKDFSGLLMMILDPSVMTLKVNGVEMDYQVFVLGDNQPTIDFKEYVFLSEFDILEGENLIEITILENDYFPGRPGGGPNVDYMKIVSNLDLVMDLFFDNIEDVKMMRGY